jgi:DNA invertase Pin-like site-specific DNA recombinase
MKSQTTVRCAAYIRVNVATRLASVQAQRDATREFIKRRTPQGWTYVGAYEDLGDSGDTLDRPALRRLLADIRFDRVDCVVVHTIDRLTRWEADLVKLLAEFRRYSVSLVVATSPSIETTVSDFSIFLPPSA